MPLRTEATGGGEGGQVSLGVVGDNNGELMLSFVDSTTLLRSTDGGENWEHAGRGMTGGSVTAAIDPTNSNRVIAINSAGNYFLSPGISGPYLSEDKAFSFTQSKGARFTIDEYLQYADSVAFDPTSYSSDIDGCAVVYWSSPDWTKSTSQHAGGNAQSNEALWHQGYNHGMGLYKSVDGGKTWQNINPDFCNSRIKVHPANGNIVYAANERGFFVSTNGGVSFKCNFETNATGLDVVDREDSTYDNYVWFCTDNGTVWQSAANGEGLVKITTNSALQNNNNPAWMVAGVYPDYACDLRVSPANPTKKMIAVKYTQAAYNCGARYAHGNEWRPIDAPTNGGKSQEICKSSYFYYYYGSRLFRFYWDPYDEDVVWTSGADWVMKSTDGGKSFDWHQKGNVGICVNSRIGVNVDNPDRIFIPIQDYNFAITSNDGRTWEKYRSGDDIENYSPGGHNYGGYSVDDNTAFYGHATDWQQSDVELCITRDGFESVTKTGIMTHSGGTNHRYSQDPKDRNVWFADNYRSADFGYTWSEMTDCKTVLTYDNITKDLYGLDSTGKKIMKSVDSGATWTVFYDFSGYEKLSALSDVAYDHENGIMYACQAPEDVSVGWGTHTFFISGHRAARAGALWKIQDGVAEELTDALLNVAYKGGNPHIVTIDPRYPNVIYVGMSGSSAIINENNWRASYEYSIARSVDGGETFQILTANNDNSIVETGPAGGRSATDFFVNPNTGVLFVSTSNYGLWKFEPPY